MKIKEIKIGNSNYSFPDKDKIFLIKGEELAEDFTKAVKDLFLKSDRVVCMDIEDCLYGGLKTAECVCEKDGNIFKLKAEYATEKNCEDETAVTYSQSFKRICRYEFAENLPETEKKRLKRNLRYSYIPVLFPSEVTDDLEPSAFYYDAEEAENFIFYTDNVADGVGKSIRYADIMINEEGYDSDYCRQRYKKLLDGKTALERFIKEFKPIKLWDKTLAFSDGELRVFGENGEITQALPYFDNGEEYDERSFYLSVWDYIVSHNICYAINSAQGKDGVYPLFIKNAFGRIKNEDMGAFISALRAVDRQVFIIEDNENATLEKLCDKTVTADDCDKFFFPQFCVPQGLTQEKYFDDLIIKKAQTLYGELTEEIRNRIEKESEIFKNNGYVNCALVIANMVAWMREKKIEFDMRGPQCCSIINYLLGITEVDPIKYGFIYEKYFVNLKHYFYPFYYFSAEKSNFTKIKDYIKERYGLNSLVKPKDYDCGGGEILFFGENLEKLGGFRSVNGENICDVRWMDGIEAKLFTLEIFEDKLKGLVSECEKAVDEFSDITLGGCDDTDTWEYLSDGKFSNPIYNRPQDGETDKNEGKICISNISELADYIAVGGFGEHRLEESYINAFAQNGGSLIAEEKFATQEDCIRLIAKLTGFDFDKANLEMRRFGRNRMPEYKREEFLASCTSNGYTREYAEEFFDKIKQFAGKIKTKTHTLFVAFDIYRLAYVSLHYPEIYDKIIKNTKGER